MTQRVTRLLLLALAALLTGACAGYQPGWEQPTVALRSFTPLEDEAGGMPGFEIKLDVINPNRDALNIQGVSYSIALQGHDLVKGVGKDFPVIEGYSTGLITLQARANLLGGIKLVTEMMSQDRPQALEYEFKGKIDLGFGRRMIRFSEKGDFSTAKRNAPREEI